MKKYLKFIVLGIVIVAILLLAGLSLVDYQRQEEIKTAKLNRDVASVKLIQAEIDVYYALQGKYPYDLNELIKKINEVDLKEKGTDKTAKSLEEAIKGLAGLKYSVRGDERAYRITYTDSKGEGKVIEANYDKDYQIRN